MFGFVFYAGIKRSTSQIELEQSIILEAVKISQQISFLPEIQCTKGKNIPEKDCIDLLKLEAAVDVISKNSLDYFDLIGFSNIYVEKIYPSGDIITTFTLYDFPKDQDKGKISTQFPISIKDPIDDTYSFGVLYVDIYR
jgi:hypothetical protein